MARVGRAVKELKEGKPSSRGGILSLLEGAGLESETRREDASEG